MYAGALLTEQAAWERDTRGGDRKALVARLYARRYLADRGPLRGIDADSDEALERFDELVDGALLPSCDVSRRRTLRLLAELRPGAGRACVPTRHHSCLSRNRCSDLRSSSRVWCGSMTASMKPRSAAIHGIAMLRL